MIFLDQKECLFSSHSDRRFRVWSVRKSEFLHRIQLVREFPKVPMMATAEPKGDHGSDVVEAQLERVASLYSDADHNSWLISGDAAGNVRVWNLHSYTPHGIGKEFPSATAST